MKFSQSFRQVVLALSFVMIIGFQSHAQGKTPQPLSSRLPAMVGLATDNRCNLYTASKHTGYVFCIPPSSQPVLLGKVPGVPTTVAVDKLRNVFVGTEDGTIFRVALDGEVREAYRCNSRPLGLEVDRDGSLLVATEDGMIVKIERTSFLAAQ